MNILREDKGNKLNDWKQDVSLGDIYYFNLKTGESFYEIPDAVRYYVPDKLSKLFSGRELEGFRIMFDKVRVDMVFIDYIYL